MESLSHDTVTPLYEQTVRYLVQSKQVPCGRGVFQQVERGLSDDERIEQLDSVGPKRNLIWNLLPEEDPVPQRLQAQQKGDKEWLLETK